MDSLPSRDAQLRLKRRPVPPARRAAMAAAHPNDRPMSSASACHGCASAAAACAARTRSMHSSIH